MKKCKITFDADKIFNTKSASLEILDIVNTLKDLTISLTKSKYAFPKYVVKDLENHGIFVKVYNTDAKL